MIYRYTKLLVTLALGMMAILQLSIAVRAYESKVHYEILLGTIGDWQLPVPDSVEPQPDPPSHSAGYIHSSPADLGEGSVNGVRL